jgi:hypothetical protein
VGKKRGEEAMDASGAGPPKFFGLEPPLSKQAEFSHHYAPTGPASTLKCLFFCARSNVAYRPNHFDFYASSRGADVTQTI